MDLSWLCQPNDCAPDELSDQSLLQEDLATDQRAMSARRWPRHEAAFITKAANATTHKKQTKQPLC